MHIKKLTDQRWDKRYVVTKEEVNWDLLENVHELTLRGMTELIKDISDDTYDKDACWKLLVVQGGDAEGCSTVQKIAGLIHKLQSQGVDDNIIMERIFTITYKNESERYTRSC